MIGDNIKGRARKWRHPARKEYYEELGDGVVQVTHDDGRVGRFTTQGRYLGGDLTQASLHMLVWTGGPQLPQECGYRWSEVPVDPTRASGWPESLEKLLHYHLGETQDRGRP